VVVGGVYDGYGLDCCEVVLYLDFGVGEVD